MGLLTHLLKLLLKITKHFVVTLKYRICFCFWFLGR